MRLTITQLQTQLLNQIPLIRHMAVVVDDYDGRMIRLAAPLAPNVNHFQTAFGGSIATLGIAAGWALLYMRLQEQDFKAALVIQRSEIEFMAPVHDDFEARCCLDDDRAWAAFTAQLRHHRRAKLTLVSDVFCNGAPVAQQTGTYAAMLSSAAPQNAQGRDNPAS